MAAEEVEDAKKNVPRGIIGSIAIATVLYIIVTLIMTGIVPFAELGVNDPVALRCVMSVMGLSDQSFLWVRS